MMMNLKDDEEEENMVDLLLLSLMLAVVEYTIPSTVCSGE
jgi:hypothetical protein